MAIYDPLSEAELKSVCDSFALQLQAGHGVPQGSINTNYRLDCAEGRFFLRFTTVRTASELDFEAGLLLHLKAAGFPCAQLLPTREGRPHLPLRKGLVSVFHHLPGEELGPDRVDPEHVLEVGRVLGRLHRVAAAYPGSRENPYGPGTLRRWLEELSSRKLDADVHDAVGRAGSALPEAEGPLALPRGSIHADLFRDNVKWVGGRIAGIFDFEMACVGELVLDLGITLDVWTFGKDGFDRPRVRALLQGYSSERPLLEVEKAGLWSRALYGAIRYTLSRIRDFRLAKAGADALERKPWERYAQRMDALRTLGPIGFSELCGF